MLKVARIGAGLLFADLIHILLPDSGLRFVDLLLTSIFSIGLLFADRIHIYPIMASSSESSTSGRTRPDWVDLEESSPESDEEAPMRVWAGCWKFFRAPRGLAEPKLPHQVPSPVSPASAETDSSSYASSGQAGRQAPHGVANA